MTDSERKIHSEQLKNSSDMKSLTDQDLVEACKTGDRAAWNEFFTRFVPLMRRAIVSVLRSRVTRNIFIPEDDDTVWDIHEKIVVKLYKKCGLSECRDARGIRAWLRTVAANQARDWLRGLNTDENLPESEARKWMNSLDEPISANGNTACGEFVEDCGSVTCERIGTAEEIFLASEYSGIIGDLLPLLSRMQKQRSLWAERLDREQVTTLTPDELAELAGIGRTTVDEIFKNVETVVVNLRIDRRKYWILRLGIMGAEPFTPDEIIELAEYSNMQIDVVREKIDLIREKLEKKRIDKEAELEKAELYRCQLIKMEQRRFDALSKGMESEAEKLDEEIAFKAESRANLLNKAMKLPRPSNKHIALFVALPEEKANDVSMMFSRVQEKIVASWRRAMKDWEEDAKIGFDLTRYLHL